MCRTSLVSTVIPQDVYKTNCRSHSEKHLVQLPIDPTVWVCRAQPTLQDIGRAQQHMAKVLSDVQGYHSAP